MPIAIRTAKLDYDKQYAAIPAVRKRRKAYMKDWYQRNKEQRLESEAKRRLEKRAQCLIATARTRARKRGLSFDLDTHVEDIQRRIDKGACELTGQPFDLSPGRKFNSPSIDRIDPSKGYLHSNVRVVLHLANAAMGDWGESVLRDVMGKWLRE